MSTIIILCWLENIYTAGTHTPGAIHMEKGVEIKRVASRLVLGRTLLEIHTKQRALPHKAKTTVSVRHKDRRRGTTPPQACQRHNGRPVSLSIAGLAFIEDGFENVWGVGGYDKLVSSVNERFCSTSVLTADPDV